MEQELGILGTLALQVVALKCRGTNAISGTFQTTLCCYYINWPHIAASGPCECPAVFYWFPMSYRTRACVVGHWAQLMSVTSIACVENGSLTKSLLSPPGKQ